MNKAHTHDCSKCKYYGTVEFQHEPWDLYACSNEHNSRMSLIARFGSEGSQYISADMESTYFPTHPIGILQARILKEQEGTGFTEESVKELTDKLTEIATKHSNLAFDMGYKQGVEDAAEHAAYVGTGYFPRFARMLSANKHRMLRTYRGMTGDVLK